MKPQRKQIVDILDEKPEWEQRRFRYNVVSEILKRHYGLNIEPKDCQLICSIADEYRHQTEKDDVGESLEKEWHRPKTMFDEEYRMDKKYQDDLQKYA